jgi:hypothetical protein
MKFKTNSAEISHTSLTISYFAEATNKTLNIIVFEKQSLFSLK